MSPFNPNKTTLSNLLEVTTLQDLQDSFARTVGMASIIIDVDGNSVTRPSNFNPVCELIRTSEEGRKKCDESDRARNQKAASRPGPIYHKCGSCGFLDASVPINIDNVKVGYWLVGQGRTGSTDRNHLAEYAAEIGVDVDEVLNYFDRLPLISPERMELVLDLLDKIVSDISSLGYKNLELKEEISVRRQAEEKLRESESKYRVTVESLGDALHIVDRDLNIQFANSAFIAWARKMGVDEKLTDKCIFEVFPFLDERVKNEYELVFRTGNKLITEESNRLGNLDVITETRKVPIIENGKAERVITIVRDITFQKRAEDQLRKFKITSDEANYGISMIDPHGKILYINEACAAMHQYKIHELIGKHVSVLHGAEQSETIDNFINTLLEKKSLHAVEIWHRRKDGSGFPSLMNATVIDDEDGLPQFISATMVDISERLRAKEELLEERDKIARITEISPTGITIVDRLGQVTFANQHAEKILRLSRAAISSRKYNDPDWHITTYDGRPYPDDKLPFAITKTTLKPVYDIRHAIQLKDGSRVLLSINAAPILDDSGNFNGMVATIQDVTEQIKTDQALQESERKFRKIVEASPMGMHLYRLDEKGDLIFEDFNPAADEILGISNQQFVGKTVETAFPALADSEIPERYKLAARDGIPWRTEQVVYKYDQIDGAYDVVAFQTSPGRMAAKFLDITERKRAEHAVKKSQQQYQELFNSVMEGIGVVDENDIIKYVNPSFAEIFDARSADEMVGQCLLDYFERQQRELIESGKDERRSGQNSQYDLEITTRAGNRKNLMVSITPRFDDDGNYRGAFGTVLDVTVTRRLQEFTARALRLETAGRIAAQVAHDFNNLLGPLIAFPELIRPHLTDNGQVREMLDDIEKSAQSMAEINQQLLTLGRRGHYNQEILSLNEIVRRAIRQMDSFPETLTVKLELDEGVKPVQGGRSQILRAVANLINNAIDAMTDGGQLILKSENFQSDQPIGNYFSIPAGEYVRLTVTDNGHGIPENALPHLFEPFFSTKSTDRGRGSGLGLSIVQAVMEDHNGFVDLVSGPDYGTEFSLYLPPATVTETSALADEFSGGEELILVVDDDDQQRKVTGVLLEKLGYAVITAAEGVEALKILKDHKPELMILDMILGQTLDGTEIFRQARQINPDIKAVIVSGYSESDRVCEARRLGVGSFLKKPLTINSIARAVRHELDRNLSALPAP